MSEDRVLMIFAEDRLTTLPVEDPRDELIWLEDRVLPVYDDERVLEVLLP